MKTTKLKLDIDYSNPAVVAALATLLNTMGGAAQTESTAVTEFSKKAEEAKSKTEKPKGEGKETFTAPEPKTTVVNGTPDVQAELKPDEEPATEPTIKLEQVRDELGKKVGDHREVIKAKLTELDAKNVSVLKPEHYDSFHAFLVAL